VDHGTGEVEWESLDGSTLDYRATRKDYHGLAAALSAGWKT